MKNITNLLFIMGVLSALFYYSYRLPILYLTTLVCGVILLIYYVLKKNKKYSELFIFITLLFLIILVKSLYFQELVFINVFVVMLSKIGLAMYMIENLDSAKIYKYIYIMLNLIVLIYIILGVNSNDISESASGNYVNYIFLSFSILYVGLQFKMNSKIIITPAILSVIVSFWTLGRSGIIASFIFLIGTIIFKLKNRVNKVLIGLLLIIMPILGVSTYKFIIKIVYNVLYRFGDRTTVIEDSPRQLILKEYIKKIDSSNFFLGYDENLYTFGGFVNTHNSYINAHYIFGLGGVFIILILLVVLIYFIFSKQYLYFIMFFSLFFRGFTDTVMFVGLYDFVLIFFILIFIEQRYYKRKKITEKYT